MNEKENIPNATGFKIPEGYFEKSRIAIQERVALERLLSPSFNDAGFEVPDRYFENNQEVLSDQLQLERLTHNNASAGFDIPNGYFENLQTRISSKTLSRKQEKTVSKKSKVISLRKHVYPAIAIAASLLLLFSVFIFQKSSNGTDNLEIASITEYFDKHDTTIYESEIEDLLTEEDLQSLESDVALEETILIDYLEDRTDSYDFYTQ